MPALIDMTNVSFKTPTGRALFEGLNLAHDGEHVALVGRNGVGKSTLLSLLAGVASPASGKIEIRSKPYYVPQADELTEPLSRGELRKRALEAARSSSTEILP
jgi:ATPase subunit of ABC transporter with duplicated ATPase domains